MITGNLELYDLIPGIFNCYSKTLIQVVKPFKATPIHF